MLTPRLSRRAERYLDRLDDATAARIADVIESLCEDPGNERNTRALRGKAPYRRARMGNYRIVYYVDGDVLEVTRIGPRGDVYKDL